MRLASIRYFRGPVPDGSEFISREPVESRFYSKRAALQHEAVEFDSNALTLYDQILSGKRWYTHQGPPVF